MTDPTNNFNDSARACLEYYATLHHDTVMGYSPCIENKLTDVFIASGELEWKALDGVKYCRLTCEGKRLLEQWRHVELRGQLMAQLDAAHKRIAELEAVCREVVSAFEIVSSDQDTVSFSVPYISGIRTIYHEMKEGSAYLEVFTALRHLLDTLPPSE